MGAAKNVYSELGSVRIASGDLIAGNVFTCGTSDELATDKGAYAVQYTADQVWFLNKTALSVPLATLGRDIVQKLEAAGWRLRSAPTPNPGDPAAATYVARRDNLDMRLVEIDSHTGGTLAKSVTIDVSSSCFNAGSSSSELKLQDGYDQQIEEPLPSSTP
jgi:hypothetical protein